MPSTFDTMVGKRIKKQRMEINYSQEQLAASTNCSYRCIQKWESGKTMPRAQMLCNLAKALHVSSDWLLGIRNYKAVNHILCNQVINSFTGSLSSMDFIFHTTRKATDSPDVTIHYVRLPILIPPIWFDDHNVQVCVL